MHGGVCGGFGERHQHVFDTQRMYPTRLEEEGCLVSGGSQVRGSQQQSQLKLARNRRQYGPPPLRA
jgi:hypothetical protein